jgi:hypothetical protein
VNQDRFDALTRQLATRQSRRGVLRGLTGTVIGGMLAAARDSKTAARLDVLGTAPNHACDGEGSCTTPLPLDSLCGGVDCTLQIGVSQCVTAGCTEGLCHTDIYALHTASCTRSALDGGGPGICTMGYCAPIGPNRETV